MKVYTFQTPQWRAVDKLKIPRYDISFKLGTGLGRPSPKLVMAYKNKQIDEHIYAFHYLKKLEREFDEHASLYNDLKAQHEQLAFSCFCTPGTFCHRYLFVQFLQRVLRIEYIGEIYRGEIIPQQLDSICLFPD